MSSATSIDRGAPAASADEKEGFRPWHFFVLVSLLAATVAVVMARQPSPEHLVMLSLAIGAAGLCGAALYATLVPLVRKDAGAERAPLSDRTRAALEREKMLALRSIKELEFDRAMGKMSPADFDEVAGRLRARAIALMKQIDASDPALGYRARIEQELASRLEKATPSPPTCTCGTVNDLDAAFCKRCGSPLQATPKPERLRPERGDGVKPAQGRPPSESERGWGPASTDK